MTVNIRHRGRRWSEDFPKNSYELLDLADKLRNDYPFSVKIENMFELNYVYNEFQISSLDDLVRLNLFAERFSEMYEEDEAIMFALMTQNPNQSESGTFRCINNYNTNLFCVIHCLMDNG